MAVRRAVYSVEHFEQRRLLHIFGNHSGTIIVYFTLFRYSSYPKKVTWWAGYMSWQWKKLFSENHIFGHFHIMNVSPNTWQVNLNSISSHNECNIRFGKERLSANFSCKNHTLSAQHAT